MSKYSDENSLDDLKKAASEANIEGRSDMNKAELIDALNAHEGTTETENAITTNEAGQQQEARDPAARTAKGEPPVFGEEGGLIKEGTGDFALDADPNATPEGKNTTKAETFDGRVLNVEAGLDGENPVTPNNPSKKAVLGGGTPPYMTPEAAKQQVETAEASARNSGDES